jgi:hypothetical protein
MQRWVERTEAKFALWAGIVGGLAVLALGTKVILAQAGSAAGLGFVFLPLVAAAAAVPVGIWGAALGHVVQHLRGRATEPRVVFWAALAAAASLPAVLGLEVYNGLTLEAAVAEASRMNAIQLERAFDESPWRRNKFYLGALAANRAAPPQLLERIAGLGDPALAEPMWSPWDVMGENRKGEAVKTLAARHPDAPASVRSRAPR